MLNCNVTIDNNTMTITSEYPDIGHVDTTTITRSSEGFTIKNMDLDGPAGEITRLMSDWFCPTTKETEPASCNSVFDGVVSMVVEIREVVSSGRFSGDTFVREVKKMLNERSLDVCEAAVPQRVQLRLSEAFSDAAKVVNYKSDDPVTSAHRALDNLEVSVSDIFKMIGVAL